MHLATTALEEFWDKQQPILFLGEWCKLYRRQEAWEELDHETLPYHWDDRDRYVHDYLYVDRLYEYYLGQLSRKLNDVHGTNHSVRYWRIVIGPWLYLFIQIFYDRYLSICTAADSQKVTGTRICEVPDEAWTPPDMDKFTDWFMGDAYNHYLYSWIISRLQHFPYETVSRQIEHGQGQLEMHPLPGSGYRKWIDKLIKLIQSDRGRRAIFVRSFIRIDYLAMLQLFMGQFPYLITPEIKPETMPIKGAMRGLLRLGKREKEFENLLSEILPEQLPIVYLEGYQGFNKKALRGFPKTPKIIMTANAHFNDEAFKLWAADRTEADVPLVTSQHGGLHGCGLISSNEKHEILISDVHYTWGWTVVNESKVRPMPSGKLWSDSRGIKPDPQGDILWVGTSCSRYAYSMLSMVIGPQMKIYFTEQKRFLENLIPEVRDLVVLRLFPREFGWDDKKRWRDIDPGLKIDDGSLSLMAQLNKSRLFIGTYNSTTMLQAFSANFPSVLFWNPRYWEMRPAAEPYFHTLKQAGILHDTPESAAAKVNEIYRDPMAWWKQGDIQGVKEEFCRHFAQTDSSWMRQWASDLEKIGESGSIG